MSVRVVTQPPMGSGNAENVESLFVRIASLNPKEMTAHFRAYANSVFLFAKNANSHNIPWMLCAEVKHA